MDTTSSVFPRWVVAAVLALLVWACVGMAPTPTKAPPAPEAPKLDGRAPVMVVGVPDGRSLVVQGSGGQEIVSLLGVAEAGQPGEGRTPADTLRDLVLDEPVFLVDHESGPRKDASGRRVVYAYRAPEGLFVNLELVRQGYARADAEFAYEHLELFKQHEARAKTAGRGLNAAPTAGAKPAAPPASAPPASPTGATGSANPQPLVTPDSGNTVYITKSGTKNHAQTCRFAKGATAVTLDEAKGKGLTPCSQCNPGR